MVRAWLSLLAVVALGAGPPGCARPAPRPTFVGGALYAQLPTLLSEGQVTLTVDATPVTVRLSQVLVTPDRTQMFAVRTLVESCGAEPDSGSESESACMLATLRDLRFEVHDTPPVRDLPKPVEDDEGLSGRAKAIITTLVIAAPLTYGAAQCEFDGCKALFGIALVADGLALLLFSVGLK